jgi:hypothetical protein
LNVTFLLITALKADIPETPFDEANTPTNEMVVQKNASSLIIDFGHRLCQKYLRGHGG